MKKLVILKTNNLLMTVLFFTILKLNMNSVLRRKWNLVCALKDNCLNHKGGEEQLRWEEKNS